MNIRKMFYYRLMQIIHWLVLYFDYPYLIRLCDVTKPTIIISIFKEDNVFSMTASLPYGPPVNTDIGYYRTFFFGPFCVSVAMLVVQYLLGEEKPMLAFGMARSGFEPMTFAP